MKKRKVLFVDESGGAWPWGRQLREKGGVWAQSAYTFATDCTGGYDWLVVYSAWPDVSLLTSVPRSRRIFVAGEPESFHRYQARFLEQFGTVITTQRGTQHPGAVLMQPGINWFAGVRFQSEAERFRSMLKFSDFEAGNPVKTKLCSVVCSSNAVTRGHRLRIEFVEQLKQEFGGQIDFFGRGTRTMADKDEALSEYRFHIALENSVHRDYWTEKLADPFLRGCFPIYSGCPNLDDYFPDGSYARIDLDKPQQAIDTIREVLRSELDRSSSELRQEAKRRILYEYNIFAELEKLYPQLEQHKTPNFNLEESIPTRLYSDHEAKDFKFSRRLRRWFRDRLGESDR
ncbi:glycosyltransferase family 10 domain-containing protein [Rhodoferax bucti]|uniref:glycosyltransferase family 10 domain-containing protein n=1 Tax=Rhodoferax bucti TaxID=2576305 RepID=UPI0014777940|nr:glycosyltransferase family 10 [Rhodoferax bucti]